MPKLRRSLAVVSCSLLALAANAAEIVIPGLAKPVELAIDKEEDGQMSARGTLGLPVPVRVADLLGAAIRAAQGKVGRPLVPGECLLEMARHFKKTWSEAVKERNTPERRARRRDEFCQVPGCSRLAYCRRYRTGSLCIGGHPIL